MITFLTQQITPPSLDWKIVLFSGIIALIMLVEFGCHSISTGEHWHMPILFAILVVTNFRNANRMRKKMNNFEQPPASDILETAPEE